MWRQSCRCKSGLNKKNWVFSRVGIQPSLILNNVSFYLLNMKLLWFQIYILSYLSCWFRAVLWFEPSFILSGLHPFLERKGTCLKDIWRCEAHLKDIDGFPTYLDNKFVYQEADVYSKRLNVDIFLFVKVLVLPADKMTLCFQMIHPDNYVYTWLLCKHTICSVVTVDHS